MFSFFAVIIGCLESRQNEKKGAVERLFPLFFHVIEFIIIYFDSAQNGRSNGILTKNSTIPALTPHPCAYETRPLDSWIRCS
jgi:hypothetical protein